MLNFFFHLVSNFKSLTSSIYFFPLPNVNIQLNHNTVLVNFVQFEHALFYVLFSSILLFQSLSFFFPTIFSEKRQKKKQTVTQKPTQLTVQRVKKGHKEIFVQIIQFVENQLVFFYLLPCHLLLSFLFFPCIADAQINLHMKCSHFWLIRFIFTKLLLYRCRHAKKKLQMDQPKTHF